MDAGSAGPGLRRGRGTPLNLSARHLGELVVELRGLLSGKHVRDVQGLPPRDLMLILDEQEETAASDAARENQGPVLRLRLSAQPEAARMHVQLGRVRRHPGPVGPFFQRLTQELGGARLTSVEQVGGDRIALLEFRETPAGERRALLAELFGRQPNLLLLGPGDRLVDWLVPAPKARAGTRPPRLALGQVWRPPGGTARGPERDAGPTLEESFPLSLDEERPRGSDLAPLSWRVEASLATRAEGLRSAELFRRLRSRVERRVERARALVHGLEERRDAAHRSERVRQDGELLKASLGELRRGQKEIVVRDWFREDSPMRRIELDPRRSPQDNVERYFERAKKLERARENVARELGEARKRLAELEALAGAVREERGDAVALEADAVARGLLEVRQEGDPRRRKPPAPRLPYRVFLAARGSELRVGRSARDNDQLTLRHSRGGDLWLHTADAPGSHVILRLERGATPDEEELLDAAHLAVHFSPLRGATRALVHVAPRKQVSKPKGAKPGLVTLAGGRKITVRMQPERLERVLSSIRRA